MYCTGSEEGQCSHTHTHIQCTSHSPAEVKNGLGREQGNAVLICSATHAPPNDENYSKLGR